MLVSQCFFSYKAAPNYTLGGLTVSNTVESVETDPPGFDYTVVFTLPADDPDTAGNENGFFGAGSCGIGYIKGGTPGTMALTKNANGTYTGTFRLKDGEAITFDDLPAGTQYAVTENPAPGTGYGLSSAKAGGSVNRSGGAAAPSGESSVKDRTVRDTIKALTDNSVEFTNVAGLKLEIKQAVNGGTATTQDVTAGSGDRSHIP